MGEGEEGRKGAMSGESNVPLMTSYSQQTHSFSNQFTAYFHPEQTLERVTLIEKLSGEWELTKNKRTSRVIK